RAPRRRRARMRGGWRQLVRDWRAGELRLLAAALAIAVASVTSVGFFGDRVSRGLARDAHQLLGADVVLLADHPWRAEILEPERSTNFFNLAPRLMMNIADVLATGLMQPGSRISYYLYAAGEPAAMAALEQTLRGELGRGERLDTLESGRPEIRAAIERA